jgi:hypothetical protein
MKAISRRGLLPAFPLLAQGDARSWVPARRRYGPAVTHVVADAFAPGAVRLRRDVVWPGLQEFSEDGSYVAGPSGPPWINSNAWLAQWHRFVSPGVPLWLAPKKPSRVLRAEDYLVALCDAESAGARWVIDCDDASWPRLEQALKFFETHRQWRDFLPPLHTGMIGSTRPEIREVMNLMSRWMVPYRLAAAPQAGMEVLIVFGAPGTDARRFAKAGGLVVSLGWTAMQKVQAKGAFAESADDHGRIAAWIGDAGKADRFVHDLRERLAEEHTALRVWNAHASTVRYTVSPDDRTALVQLINSHGRRHNELTTVWVRQLVDKAVLHQIGVAPKQLETVRRAGGTEISLPDRDFYAAIELTAA